MQLSKNKKYNELLLKLSVLVQDIQNTVAIFKGSEKGDLLIPISTGIIVGAKVVSAACTVATVIINAIRNKK